MTAKHKAAIRRGIRAAAKARKKSGAKPHWTKTKKGREHMKQMGLKRGELMRAAKLLQENTSNGTHEGPSYHSGFIQGKVETIIEYYCIGKNLSPAALAADVGELLRHSQNR